jgi:signal transduction histidine kinase
VSALGRLVGVLPRRRRVRLPRRRPAAAWVLAVAGPALITLGWLPFRSFLGPASFLFTTLVAVVAVGLLGGARPALMAVVLGLLSGAYFFAPPYGSLRADRPGDLVALVAFIVVGGAVGILVDDLARLAEQQAALRDAVAASRARIVATADETRRRIERDLHDGAQQRLVALALDLRAAQTAVPPELGELQAELSRVAEGLASALDELQEFARGIHPAILAEGGLGPALKTLARRSPVPVELDVRAEPRLPERVEIAAYYVVSETLTNAAKHAHASVVHVEVESADGALRVSVRDDGAGGADPARGSGLVGLRDRVEALGGAITIQSPPGAGTSVDVELPISD